MNNDLVAVLTKIGEAYEGHIAEDSRFYLVVDIGKKGEEMGNADLKERYRNVNAVVPLKHALKGMKVRIDGRTFVDYAQLESGIAVPGYVGREAGLPHKAYKAQDSMILNFA